MDASLGGTIEGGAGTDILSLVGLSSDAFIIGVEFVVGGSGSDRLTVTTNDVRQISGGDGLDGAEYIIRHDVIARRR